MARPPVRDERRGRVPAQTKRGCSLLPSIETKPPGLLGLLPGVGQLPAAEGTLEPIREGRRPIVAAVRAAVLVVVGQHLDDRASIVDLGAILDGSILVMEHLVDQFVPCVFLGPPSTTTRATQSVSVQHDQAGNQREKARVY